MSYRALVVTAALLGAAAPALAEGPGDRFWGQGGGFFTTSDLKVRLDNVSLGNIGTTVDFERDIGLPTHDTVPYGTIGARLGRKFRVEAEYFNLSRTGNKTLSQSITVDNTTFTANANIAGLFESTTYRFGLGYSPVLTDTAELGVAVGFHVTDFQIQLLGAGTVTNGTSTGQAAIASEIRKQLAPLPTIGAYGNYDITPMFGLHAKVDWLSLKIGDYSGSLVDAQANVTARVIKHVGVGAGYRYTNYTFKARKDDFSGRLGYKFDGPIVFVEIAF